METMQKGGSDPLSLFNFIHNVYKREGSQARSTASGSGPDLAGVLGFESHPSHRLVFPGFLNVNKPEVGKKYLWFFHQPENNKCSKKSEVFNHNLF